MEEEGLLSAPKYFWGCCHVCKRAGSKTEPLKRCSRCSCMFYCSKEHQKEDWKDHKKVCSYLATAAEEVGAETFFGHQIEFDDDDDDEVQEERPNDKAKSWRNWTKFRVNAVKMCEILIGRPLAPFEKEIFLFPKACRQCRIAKKDGMIDCHDCMGVTFCSSQHFEDHLEKHKRHFCQELKYAMVCDNYESTVSIAAPPIPSNVDKIFNENLESMERHLGFQSKRQEVAVDLAEMEFRFLSDRLTGPLTILYAGSKFGLAQKAKIQDADELVIHIAGSNIIEMLGIIKWEYIIHRLAKLSKLHLVFIGLELEGEEAEGECPDVHPCDKCANLGKQVKYEIRKMTYDEYNKKCPDYLLPSMVCVFNCGFHEFSEEPDKETWHESLPSLTRYEGVPLVFTSYTKTEAEKDLHLILQSNNNLHIDAQQQVNPFRSHRPIRDFEFDNDCDVFYANQYLSIVRRMQ